MITASTPTASISTLAPALELALGNPAGGGMLRFDDIVADEDRSRVTRSLRSTLFDDAGLGSALVSPTSGGVRPTAWELMGELRALFRRDPSVGAELAALPLLATAGIWTHPAARIVAPTVLAGGPLAVGLGLAQVAGIGDSVDGVIDLMSIPAGARHALVRTTGPDPHMVVVEIDEHAGFAETGRRRTTGLRSVRFASVELRRAPVRASWAPDAAADEEARALVAGLWVATVDTAIRIAVPYAQGRGLYGGTVWDLPHARSLIADARTDLLIADAIVLAGLDGSTATAALELVPRLLGDAMRSLTVLFGSTFYARVEPFAVFETLVRDVASMSLLQIRSDRVPSQPVDTPETSGAVTRGLVLAAANEVAAGPVADRLAALAGRGARHPSDEKVWQALSAVTGLWAGGREPLATSLWLNAALTRLEMRLSRRRAALSDEPIEAAIADVEHCVDRRRALTFDRVEVFPPSTFLDNEGARS